MVLEGLGEDESWTLLLLNWMHMGSETCLIAWEVNGEMSEVSFRGAAQSF